MRYTEKKKAVAELLAAIENADNIASLLELTGKVFFEIFSAFDTDHIKSLENNGELLVQSILIPTAQNMGKSKTRETQKEIDIAIEDILALFEDSYISE